MSQDTTIGEEREQREDDNRNTAVHVTANYLPSSETYRHSFLRTDTIGTVKADVMLFFKVADFKDRDTHTFHLMFEGQQRDDLGTSLGQLLKGEQRHAHFQLIEKIQAG